MRNKIAVAIIIITTLIPTVETCLAKQLPFSKPIDFISGKTYGGNKKVWDVEFDDEGRLFVAASEKLCIWNGMDWTSIDFGNCLRDLYFDKETRRLYASGDNIFGYWYTDDYGQLQFVRLYSNLDNRNYLNFWRIVPVNDILYVQTHNDLYAYNLKENRLEGIIDSGIIGYIFPGSNNIFAQIDGVLYSFIDKTKTPTGIVDKDRIVEVRRDGQDIIYVTEYGGVKRYHDGQVAEEFPGLNKVIGPQRIFSAKIRTDKSYLLGTVMDGLYIASPTGEILEHFNESNGLECTTILCVEENLNGDCWFGLDEGLAHFNANGAETAFISQEKNIGDVYDYALWNNTLYLGTNKGLYRIDEDKKAHLVTGTSGIVWNIVNCKDFLAVEIDENLYVIYPDNTYDNILSGIYHLTKWAYSDNLVMCSDSKGIILLEKRNGRLEIRNRLGNCDGYCQAPLKNDNLGNIWVDGLLGGVQRLTLDKGKQNVIKDKFYPIGDKRKIVKSHYVDNRIVFSQGKDCYIYNIDADSITLSKYYSDISHCFETDIFSLAQKDNLYFNYCDDNVGIVERQGDTLKLISGTFSKAYDFSQNYSHFSALNDSLMAIGCNNGLALFNVNVRRHNMPEFFGIRQCSYMSDGMLNYAKTADSHNIILTYNSQEIRLLLAGMSHKRTVYYSIDNSPKTLIRDHSFIQLPHLSKGVHKISFTDNSGKVLMATDIEILGHWTNSWWFILAVLSALAGLIYVIDRILKRRSLALEKKYKEEHDEFMEKERIKYENEKLTMELREKNAKLSAMAINDTTINNMLKEIEQAINEAIGDSSEIKTSMKPVKRIIDRHFRENGSWKAFELYFNGVYDGFIDRLKQKYPHLTQNDIKICSYIRMGMSSKEIASLMNIEVISAQSARYRLRKNMGLSQEDSLSDIISKI